MSIYFPINVNTLLCDDTHCVGETLQARIENNEVVLNHDYPLTPWKSNNEDILWLDKESALTLADALIELANTL